MSFLLAGVLLCLAPQDDKPKSIQVTVLEVKGSVEFKVPGKGAKWAKLAKDATLKRGAMVQTGIKSRAVLKFGKDTKVLVRGSTFAVINESFVKKNSFEGELRVDVGSVHVETDEDREEELEFKVKTPQGTAAVRGTRLTVRTNAVGMEALGQSGITNLNTIYGGEYRIGVHLRQLATSTAGDLARMFRHRSPTLANDNLGRIERLLGDRSWATRGLNPPNEENNIGHQVHVKNLCGTTNGPVSFFECADFYRWQMDYDGSYFNNVKGLTPISGVVFVGPGNDWDLTLHGRVVYTLRDQNPCPGGQYDLDDAAGTTKWIWNDIANTWTLQ